MKVGFVYKGPIGERGFSCLSLAHSATCSSSHWFPRPSIGNPASHERRFRLDIVTGLCINKGQYFHEFRETS
jgi:hypothetical protein